MAESMRTIIIKVRRDYIEDGVVHRGTKEDEMPLSEKLSEYLLRLGYSNDHVLGIVLRLMEQGKVQIEFRDFRERLEMKDPANIVPRTRAVSMFDAFIEELKGDASSKLSKVTQRIVVQPPRATK
jgi:hypothetical protein